MALPLQTQQLLLRKLKPTDLPQLARYRDKPDVARFQSWEHYTLQDAEKLYAKQHSLTFNSDGTWYQLAVERLEDGALIGDIGIHFFDEGRQAELGMTFDVSYQKRGYAREAMRTLIEVLFNTFTKHRLTAVVDTRNTRAVNLLDKLGFRCEAHYRQNIFFKGEWGDEYLYALLNSDYCRACSVEKK
ncbi:GNAT family N-acetyltransferase [Kosakonia sacchari]|uniref:GNAT family N-acetyltransferase n=1 Tax=Kosakonia sacchari TaxID=1158459 RepID=UPI002ACE9275|nr:GNAT family protein [Kosakonia sacchari]MDZ7320094.1 GNAT family N-acetyltransferase [Kosakonia sacchari]